MYQTTPPAFLCLFPPIWESYQLEAGVKDYEKLIGRVGLFRFNFFTQIADSGFVEQQKWARGLLTFASTSRLADYYVTLGLPTINLSSRIRSPLVSVLNDEFEMAKRAATHFANFGATSIIYIGLDALDKERFRKRRAEGCRFICSERGLEFVEKRILLKGSKDLRTSELKAAGLIAEYLRRKKKPISIIAEDPIFSSIVVEAAGLCKLRLGEELAIIQLCDSRERHTGTTDDVSFIPHDWVALGHLAAKTIRELVEDGVQPPKEQLVPPHPIFLTRSSDPSLNASLYLRVRSYLAHSTDYSLSVREIADIMGVSETTLYREFVEKTGHSLKHELIERKLEFASRLLRETNITTEEISARCGYSTSSNFSTAFRARYNMTPNNWKNRFS